MGIANLAAMLGAGLAMGLGAVGSGLGLGYAASGALRAISRQPAKQPELFRNMLVAQAITETPAIFALVVSFLLYFSQEKPLDAANSPAQAAAFLAAGLCVGVGAIGSGIGSGLVAHDALDGMSANPASQGQVLLLMLIGQAWVQTGCIFALVISLFLLTSGNAAGLSAPQDPRLWSLIPLSSGELLAAARRLGSGLAMGFGAIGSSLGIAFVGGQACRWLASAPGAGARIKTVFFVGSATAQSPSVFSLIIALILLLGA
ncbi:MAG: ATP synthase F0 subunit C [Planctomycetota bacterium]|jgi:F0F1-type ATP synthase membrane subunit c/vacuolar-type H+-ATPase subunit K|nr:ATP synthase F0 subunit C [Planctomycetota bacterium]